MHLVSPPGGGWFESFTDALEQLETGALAVLCLGLILFTLLWALEIEISTDQSEWAMAWLLWLLMLGASRAMATGSHPSLPLLAAIAPRWQARISRLMFALGSVVCLALAMATLALVALEIRFEGQWAAGLPSWQVLLIMPLALAMLTARMAAMTLAPSAWLLAGRPDNTSGQ